MDNTSSRNKVQKFTEWFDFGLSAISSIDRFTTAPRDKVPCPGYSRRVYLMDRYKHLYLGALPGGPPVTFAGGPGMNIRKTASLSRSGPPCFRTVNLTVIDSKSFGFHAEIRCEPLSAAVHGAGKIVPEVKRQWKPSGRGRRDVLSPDPAAKDGRCSRFCPLVPWTDAT